jgi:hypothetical protein
MTLGKICLSGQRKIFAKKVIYIQMGSNLFYLPIKYGCTIVV